MSEIIKFSAIVTSDFVKIPSASMVLGLHFTPFFPHKASRRLGMDKQAKFIGCQPQVQIGWVAKSVYFLH